MPYVCRGTIKTGELLKVISSCNNLKSLCKAVEVPSQAGRVPVGIFHTQIPFLGCVEG